MFTSPTLSHFSYIILLQVASSYQGSTIMMGMSMWYVILVPFFIMMMVLGAKRRRNTHTMERRKKWKGMMKMIVMIPKTQRDFNTFVEVMSQDLGEGKGVEPQNLHTTIVIKLTQVPIPMGESIYVGLCTGMKVRL